MDLSQVTFTVNGEKKKLPDGTKSGDIVALPWLNGTYTLKHESSTSPSTPEGSAPANDDTIAGIYEIRVNFNGVTASEGSQSIDLHNQPGTLTVRPRSRLLFWKPLMSQYFSPDWVGLADLFLSSRWQRERSCPSFYFRPEKYWDINGFQNSNRERGRTG